MDIYYKNIFLNKNYTTDINNTISLKKRLTKVERSKINIDEPLNEIIIGHGIDY